MAIYTSRYSNKELQNGKYYPIGISLGAPKFSLGYELRGNCYSLAPKGYMFKLEPEPFKAAYYKKLYDIGAERIIDMVIGFDKSAQKEGKELVLLCYEDIRIPSEWCHRTIFAEWWAENTGEIIEELIDPTPPKQKGAKNATKTVRLAKKKNTIDYQMDLFSMV